MDWVNKKAEAVNDFLVEHNAPSFGVGYNSTYGTGFYVGNNPTYYPGYEKKIANGQQNISNQLAEVIKEHGAAWRSSSNGIFGSNYELGPIGIGLNFEIANPDW